MNSISLKIFLQFWLQYISELQVKKTKICFAAPVSFEEGLRRTIVYEFVKNAQGYAVNKYYCSNAGLTHVKTLSDKITESVKF